jgi:hypothetical protein
MRWNQQRRHGGKSATSLKYKLPDIVTTAMAVAYGSATERAVARIRASRAKPSEERAVRAKTTAQIPTAITLNHTQIASSATTWAT